MKGKQHYTENRKYRYIDVVQCDIEAYTARTEI